MMAADLTQSDLATTLGITQTQVSARLRGATRWSVDDLDALRDIGVPITLSAYDVLGVGA